MVLLNNEDKKMSDNVKVWIYRTFQSILLIGVLFMQYAVMTELSTTSESKVELTDASATK